MSKNNVKSQIFALNLNSALMPDDSPKHLVPFLTTVHVKHKVLEIGKEQSTPHSRPSVQAFSRPDFR